MPLLEIRNLKVSFASERGTVHAVNDVSYSVEAGETLGIVGESGSGKSVQMLAMLGLVPRRRGLGISGAATFDGRNLLAMSEAEHAALRGRQIGFIFQDPMTSLNPVLRVGYQIAEPLRRHLRMTPAQARARAIELLSMVEIRNPAEVVRRFPHELSGGMRQRIMIAMAISCEPRLLIADEPTTALDVTVQGQVIDIVSELKRRLGMTMIWISHDMGVIAGLADTVQVMYAGRIMERGPVRSVFYDTRSAYTWGLLRSLPRPEQTGGERLQQIRGQPPDLIDLPKGDPFAPRNPFATPRCFVEPPPLVQAEAGAPGHLVAAWYDLRAALAAQSKGAA
jgi:peptide/nickel transport system ATP-binding protein/oligopeptide transport system ATP-binding protein